MAEDDFILALQARLAAEVVTVEAACRLCGETLDATGAHSMCCAKGGRTRYHYTVVPALVDGIATVDPSVRTEVRGLTSSSERPADILSERYPRGECSPGCLCGRSRCMCGGSRCMGHLPADDLVSGRPPTPSSNESDGMRYEKSQIKEGCRSGVRVPRALEA